NAARAPGAGGRGGPPGGRGGAAQPAPGTPAGPPKFLTLGGSAKYGVAYYAGDGKKIAPRIVVTTGSGYIVQLDAKSGALYKKFGVNGALDLRINAMEKFRYS